MFRHPRSSASWVTSMRTSLRLVLRTTLLAALTASVAHASVIDSATNPVRASAAPMLEPTTLLLVGIGLVGIAIFRTRYRHEKQ